MTYTHATIEGLAHLRTYAAKYPSMGLSEAINALDNAGVFAALDEQTDYASAEEILAEATLASVPNTADPAEWGDTTSADMARHQGLGSGLHRRVPLDEPLTGEEARRMRDALKGTRCTCGRPEVASPSLHSGNCPVWMKHHNLIAYTPYPTDPDTSTH